MFQKRSFSGYRALRARGGRWRRRFLSQKPSQNQRPDTLPMLARFETPLPRAPAFFPPASTLQGRRGGSIDISMCIHTNTTASQDTLPRTKKGSSGRRPGALFTNVVVEVFSEVRLIATGS